ncbi:MAG: hypothetical protein PHR18_05755, partial [Oscillospiraceae bacterium]|nr:hypothetical protein [Oscillospiraceae bacterium]
PAYTSVMVCYQFHFTVFLYAGEVAARLLPLFSSLANVYFTLREHNIIFLKQFQKNLDFNNNIC